MKPDRILRNWFRRIERVRECEQCGAGHESGAVMQYCVGISFGGFVYGYFCVDCQEGPEYRDFPLDTTWYRFDLLYPEDAWEMYRGPRQEARV